MRQSVDRRLECRPFWRLKATFRVDHRRDDLGSFGNVFVCVLGKPKQDSVPPRILGRLDIVGVARRLMRWPNVSGAGVAAVGFPGGCHSRERRSPA
jgi:hypothetical protein